MGFIEQVTDYKKENDCERGKNRHEKLDIIEWVSCKGFCVSLLV